MIESARRRGRLSDIRAAMRAAILADEAEPVRERAATAGLALADRQAISARAVGLVRTVRATAGASIMQGFLAEYGLSSREGVALMCLAEALLRVPDTGTIDALIEDKIGASDWAAHLGQSSSPLINASTWALLLTGKVLGEGEGGLAAVLKGAVRRLLENGANSSFVSRIVDESVSPKEIARDPVAVAEGFGAAAAHPAIAAPADLFRPGRENSKGWSPTGRARPSRTKPSILECSSSMARSAPTPSPPSGGARPSRAARSAGCWPRFGPHSPAAPAQSCR